MKKVKEISIEYQVKTQEGMKTLTFKGFNESSLELYVDKEQYYQFTKWLPKFFRLFFTENPKDNTVYGTHEIAKILTERGIIDPKKGDVEDCESGMFWVSFTSKERGIEFLNDLNAYLQEKHNKFQQAKSF